MYCLSSDSMDCNLWSKWLLFILYFFQPLQVVEDASAKSEKRKKTPPDMSQDDRRRLVQELGRKPSQEKVSLYVKSNSAGGSNKQAEDSGAGPEPVESKSGGGDVNGQASSSTKARQMIESMSRRSVDVPTDILLKPIKEDNEELRYLWLRFISATFRLNWAIFD